MIAYLDPGSGSIIATFIVGGIASIGVAFKTLRARVGGIFRRDKDTADESEASDVSAEADVEASAEDVEAEDVEAEVKADAAEAETAEAKAEVTVSGGDAK